MPPQSGARTYVLAGKIAAVIETIASEQVHLLPERALYWPARRMLMVADIHFGKAAAFRAQGIPVPHGTTAQNLASLDSLLGSWPIDTIVFLGDFLHARAARAPATLAAIAMWRARHPDLRLILVRGNHDRHAGDPPSELLIEPVNEPYHLAPFSFCHHPDLPAPGFVIAGHVHPVYRLSRRGDSVRLPCFVLGPTSLILPSFGAFTGGFVVTPATDERIYLAVDDVVLPVRKS